MILALLMGLGLAPGVRCATADAERMAQASRLLARMATALSTLDYQGTLVYLIENRLETLWLLHRVVEGRVEERLISQSGPPRELARERDRITCLMPEGHPISLGLQPRRHRLQTRPIDPAALSDRYRIAVPGTARVAGRDTDVLVIHPRDDLRYGYRFHLDRATGLPLKSDLIDARGEAIEQLLFTSIELIGGDPANGARGGESAPPSAAVPSSEPPTETLPGPPPEDPPTATRWQFQGRSPGFELVKHELTQDAQGAAVEHFVFSDQLSSYSVFIEDNTANGLRGATRIGAVHASGRSVDGHQVTVVGEVPAVTVDAAVMGVSRAAARP